MSVSGRIAFLPWVTLPYPVTVGGFRFSPIRTDGVADIVGAEVAETVAQILQLYVDRAGGPIESCTILLRPRHSRAWDIPGPLWRSAVRASEVLALACLAEQRFFMGHFSPHLNASMFRLVAQGITGSDKITVSYARRGNGLRVFGRFQNVRFQQPHQVEGTRCELIGTRLAKALMRARRVRAPVWEPIASSLEFFLLGHSETPELGWDSCIMLSAMAFEKLLEPSQRSAQGLAAAFADLWTPYTTLTITNAKRVKPDKRPDFAAVQQTWPLHRKWMKELYEVRSSRVHNGPASDFSQNWKDWQHMVIVGFAYPFAVKLKLMAAGLYQLKDREIGACRALDRLLDSHWGRGFTKDPEWPSVLSLSEYEPIWDRMHQEAQSGMRVSNARIRKNSEHRSYD